MKFHFSSSRGETKNNFSSRISRDRDSCQGLEPLNDRPVDPGIRHQCMQAGNRRGIFDVVLA